MSGRCERGSALLVVVFALSMAVLIGAIAITNTVAALRTSDHQANLKRAQQAADAAIDDAVFALNRLDLIGALNIDSLDPAAVLSQHCVTSTSGGTVLDLVPMPPTSSWCPAVTGDNGAWSYRVSALTRVGNGVCGDGALLSLDRRIVATGISKGVERRVAARLRAPVSLLSGAAVQSGSTSSALTMAGTARVTGNVHANAAITGAGGAPVITGNATAGYGASVSGIVPVGLTGSACHRFQLPDVVQGTAPSTNDNADPAFAADRCADWALNLLTIACDLPLLPRSGGAEWDASKRTLRLWGNAKVTLTGHTYSFCRVRLEGQSMLVVPPGATPTRIFLDAPENCPGVTAPGTWTSDGLSRVVNCHPQTDPGSLQLYAVGSSSAATTLTFAGGGTLTGTAMSTVCGANIPLAGTPMMIYAPHSQVVLSGSAAIAGQVAADTVSMSGAASVTSVNSLVNLNELGGNPVLPLYRPQNYVSCTSLRFAELPPNEPDRGC